MYIGSLNTHHSPPTLPSSSSSSSTTAPAAATTTADGIDQCLHTRLLGFQALADCIKLKTFYLIVEENRLWKILFVIGCICWTYSCMMIMMVIMMMWRWLLLSLSVFPYFHKWRLNGEVSLSRVSTKKEKIIKIHSFFFLLLIWIKGITIINNK